MTRRTHTAAHFRIALFGLMAACVGCDLLLIEPGSELAVDIEGPTTVELSQQIEPLKVRFRVSGCERFEVSAALRTTSRSADLRLDAIPQPDGALLAEIPLSFLFDGTDECGRDERAPFVAHPRLSLRCLIDERRVESDTLIVSVATAWRADRAGRGPVSHVIPGEDAGEFYAVGSGWLSLNRDGAYVTDQPLAVEQGRDPLVARDGDRLLVWVGCPLPSCGSTFWDIDGGIQGTAATRVFAFSREGDRLDVEFGEDIVTPADLTGMAVDDAGALIALSQTSSSALLSIFEPDQARVVIPMEGESSPTALRRRDDGALVFMTLDIDDALAWLHEVGQGEALALALPAQVEEPRLSMAPGGRAWALLGRERAFIGQGEGQWTELAHDLESIQGLAWVDGALAIHDEGAVEVFEVEGGGRVSRFDLEAPLGESRSARVRGLTAAGRRILVSTDTGVQILSAEGVPVGGADPLPCGASPASVAVKDDLALVATRDALLWLDLSRYAP